MSKKERIDVLLVEKGYFPSREKARAAIMAGLVFVEEERCEKPGTKVEETVTIRVKGELHPYVSRGGLKLEKAIKSFQLNLEDAVVMDIGASTGGFTDCALQNGARQVYAIDVGYGQLDWKLRSDSRVIVMERTNFRHLQPEQLKGDHPNFATIDVSFISLKIILPVLATFLEPGAHVVALVKPQFEAGREQVGKNGIVREPSIHEQVLTTMVEFSTSLGYYVQGIDYSPITGGEGNIEFLLLLRWKGKELDIQPAIDAKEIRSVVDSAHSAF
ncbi:TlyA family RNA methyltransferase [Ammoniphilus sp. YIM 78166]|uniref:TlyA family RNA methyltransferase n=1 Tax=Ammoniphilus sp. YIM 78166 TaxID=1644106 RepID=UPI00106FB78E|nr:TlyA family RNA methyltransferase [Ammoniphilus sp. YIM 78166]